MHPSPQSTLCSLVAVNSQFSVFIEQKMQLTGWENANNMRNAKCAGTQTSMEWPYCSFLYCATTRNPVFWVFKANQERYRANQLCIAKLNRQFLASNYLFLRIKKRNFGIGKQVWKHLSKVYDSNYPFFLQILNSDILQLLRACTSLIVRACTNLIVTTFIHKLDARCFNNLQQVCTLTFITKLPSSLWRVWLCT